MSQKKARAARQTSGTGKPGGSACDRSRLLWGAAAVVAVALVGVGLLAARGTGPAAAVNVSSGKEISLSGTDPITSKNVSFADYPGKPIVLNVWASWCEGCRAEAVALRQFAERHPEVQVIGLDQQDSAGPARDFYAEFGWKHPSINDRSGEIAKGLGLQGLPTTYFLDGSHRIVTRIVGETDLAGFEQALEQALAST